MPPGVEPLRLFRTLAHNPRVLSRFLAGGLLDHALDDTLCRKWEAPTNGVGIPATYGQLDAG